MPCETIIERFVRELQSRDAPLVTFLGLLEEADAITGRGDAAAFANMIGEAHRVFSHPTEETSRALLVEVDVVRWAARRFLPALRTFIGPARAETVGDSSQFVEAVVRNVATLRWAENMLTVNLLCARIAAAESSHDTSDDSITF
jgi:hypothetical protein